jgi:hypothetical protein
MCILHSTTPFGAREFLADNHYWKAQSVERLVTAGTGGNAMRVGAIAECISARAVRTRSPNLTLLSHLDVDISSHHSHF